MNQQQGERRERGDDDCEDDDETAAKFQTIEGLDVNEVAEAVVNEDDVYWGGELCPEMVKEGRLEEVTFMKKIGVFDFVPVAQCWERTGKAPVSTRFVDVKKIDANGL